jgi:glycosyltransferase involved in cell wall biosynthesis
MASRNDSMRVVFLTHNYPRTPGDVAGTFLQPLAVALAARGHDVRVIAPSDRGQGGGIERADGVAVERVRYASAERERYAYTGRMQEAIRSPGGWLALAGLLRAMRAATRRALNGDRRAVVHAHWWFPAGLAAPPDRPCVVTLHGTDARLFSNPAARWLARRALRSPRVVTAVSTAVARLEIEAVGRPIGPDHISPMPLDQAAGSLAEPGGSQGGGGLVFVGRLTEQKRVGLALDALARLEPALRLTIVGDGPDRSRLERRATELGLGDRVRFLGMIAPGAVGATLATADLFVFPAEAEGLGLSAMEALAAGVPVVACTDGGGVLDVVSEPGGGRVAAPDPAALAKAIEELLADPGARRRARAAGEAWQRRLAPEAVAARCETWYREAIRG